MVYCGKPSRGCQMCRTRRIKCDETKPTCNQCAKSRRQCPGYKDEFDLVFRNETQATERRARKANRKAAIATKRDAVSATGAEVVMFSPTLKDEEEQSPTDSVRPALTLSAEDQASCHFLSNYVLIPRQGATRGYMEFLVPLLQQESGNKHLRLAFNACAMAALGNRTNFYTSKIGNQALIEYSKALQLTQAAIKDPEESKSDATIAAVLLLSLFENITAKQIGMLAWGSHVEGAVNLVKVRGKKQLQSKIGLHIFIAARTQMIIQTMTSAKAPINGVDWWINDAVKDEFGAACQRLAIKTAELRAEVTRLMTGAARSPEHIEIMLDMIRRSQMVDQEIDEWMRSLPESYRYKTIAWEDNVPGGDYSRAEVFPGRVDVYQDFWTASVWNMARSSRLCLASVIVRCAAWVCSPVDYRTTPEYATAARTCVDTITDILASVPYNLGWHLKRPDVAARAATVASAAGFACGEENHQKGLAGYFLTWPLAIVNGQDYATVAQRSWVVGRLRYIGDEMGVKYAHILADLNLRLPSMLIRRDGLMAQPYANSPNMEKMLAAVRAAPPAIGQMLNPFQQWEALQQDRAEHAKAQLLAKASASQAGKSGEWVAQKLLQV